MIRASKMRLLLSATIALSAAMATPGPAMAQHQEDPDALYYLTYYNEDYSQEMGREQDNCNSWGVSRNAVYGVQTPYVWKQLYAYCRNGQLSLT